MWGGVGGVNKLYQNKDWLYDQYWIKEKSSEEIAEQFNLTRQGIIFWLKKFKIKRRTTSNAQKLALKKGRAKIHGFNIKPYAPKGSKSHNWKGNNASYGSIHSHIRRLKGDPTKCEKCGKKDSRIELSFNHSLGDYTRNPEDYKYLCSSCHIKREYHEFGIKCYRGW